jgi:uncharacterized membrane protein YgcG
VVDGDQRELFRCSRVATATVRPCTLHQNVAVVAIRVQQPHVQQCDAMHVFGVKQRVAQIAGHVVTVDELLQDTDLDGNGGGFEGGGGGGGRRGGGGR